MSGSVLKRADQSTPSGQKKERVTVWLDPVLLKDLKHESIDRDRSVSELVEEAVRARAVAVWKK